MISQGSFHHVCMVALIGLSATLLAHGMAGKAIAAARNGAAEEDAGILIMYQDTDTEGNPFWGYGFCFNTTMCYDPASAGDIRYWDSQNRTKGEWESFVGEVQKVAADADNYHMSLHYSLIRLEWYHLVHLKKGGTEYAVEPDFFWKEADAKSFIQKAVAKLPYAPVKWGEPELN
jgi:hypothetical protein